MIDIIAVIKDSAKTDDDKIQEIQSSGYDLDTVDENNANISILHTATLNGGLALFQWLLQQKPSLINAQSSSNTNVFFYALKYANKEIISYILSNHVNLITEININGQNAFHFAALGNNEFSLFEQLRTFKISLKTPDNFGCLPVHYAAESGAIHALTYLIGVEGKDCCSTPQDNELGDTPLIVAAKHNQFAFVDAILAQFEDLQTKTTLMAQKNKKRYSLAHAAAEGDCVSLLEKMHESNIPLHEPDHSGGRFIHYAAKNGAIRVLTFFIKVYGIDCCKASGGSLLMVAAIHNQFAFVEAILAQFEDRQIKTTLMTQKNQKGYSLAHAAAQGNCVPLLEKMRELRISLNHYDDSGWSPIHHAAKHGAIDTLTYFLGISSGLGYGVGSCRVPVKDLYGDTPLLIAIQHNQFEFVKAILEHFKNKKSRKAVLMAQKNQKGYGLAHAAAKRDFVFLLKKMRELGMLLDEPSNSGWMPIHYAAKHGSIHALIYFIKIYGIGFCNATNQNGDTPFMIASYYKQSAFIEELLNQIEINKEKHANGVEQDVVIIEKQCRDRVVSVDNASSAIPVSAVSSGYSMFSTTKRSNASHQGNDNIKKQRTDTGVSSGSSSSGHLIFPTVNAEGTNQLESGQPYLDPLDASPKPWHVG